MRKQGLSLIVLLLIGIAAWWAHRPLERQADAPEIHSPQQAGHGRASESPSGTGDLPSFLPPEARQTLRLIADGGPFPYHQDGVVFGNREGRLPEQPRGFYHEYTVATPGASNRGTRRIITGGSPPLVYYYTDDHYETFRRFQASP
ncbi:MAG TPA: ribonuclease [Luteibacter sp.]|nr:ribonuclease [Luteibacter sp.]